MSSGISPILGLLGVVVQGLDGLVGIRCNPVVVGEDCNNTPMCCEENGIGNLISVGGIVIRFCNRINELRSLAYTAHLVKLEMNRLHMILNNKLN
ncbi:uncharacterized protein B0H18DRAFT_1212203 [Fomitopsis serialis]|uniref:uncharacterized protein n=1 Tax=Fomitopsis serialis TaxID=139415 RepID=UPI002007E472|nr:uncharacterized protein B0H18DRAFT_1212203 [Neoantrodia serialis]KAH9923487.1 hypothetical protein B0H18DRAFT_1212203 [Neoantrodia serialis]